MSLASKSLEAKPADFKISYFRTSAFEMNGNPKNCFLQAFRVSWLTTVKYLLTSSQSSLNHLRHEGANVFSHIRL